MASYDPDFRHDPDRGETLAPGDAEPRRRGCLFYGLVGLAIVSVALMLTMALTAWVGYRTFVRYRDMYTSTTPVALPKIETSERERQRIAARVEAFREAVEAGEDVEPLTLSGDDLNALVQESPRLKDRVYLSLDDDRVKARVSIPLSELQDFSLTRGRYLNGEAELKLELDDGRLKLEVLSMRAEGKELPQMVCNVLTHSDFVLESDDDDPADSEGERRFKGFLRKLDSVKIEDGRMIVAPREPD